MKLLFFFMTSIMVWMVLFKKKLELTYEFSRIWIPFYYHFLTLGKSMWIPYIKSIFLLLKSNFTCQRLSPICLIYNLLFLKFKKRMNKIWLYVLRFHSLPVTRNSTLNSIQAQMTYTRFKTARHTQSLSHTVTTLNNVLSSATL